MRFLKVKRNGREVVEPLDNKALFKHCTGGFICVTAKEFIKDTVKILHSHGIDLIHYEGETNV